MKHLSFRVDGELLDKFHYVAKFDDRSANAQLNYLVRQYVEAFEKEHGQITKADIETLYRNKK